MYSVGITSPSDGVGDNWRNRINRKEGQGSPTLTVRLATGADVDAYFGFRPQNSLKAYVALLDGEPMGLVGVSRETYWQGGYGKYFADFKDELQPYLRSIPIMRAVKKSLKWCDEYRGPMISIAQHAEGCRMLHRLGFEHMEGAYYAWLTYNT